MAVVIFVIAAATAYLFHIYRVGYTNDDWYLMYAGKVGGSGYFADLFSFDRPVRAYIFAPLYLLFGENPLLYNLLALFLRIVSAVLLLWVLRLIWPRQRVATFTMALIYLLYPGFLSQLNGIDYQPIMVSLVAAMLSLGLGIYAFYEKRNWLRQLWIGLAILFGWLYIGLVEYEASFEFLRVGILLILVCRQERGWRARFSTTLKTWLPYALIPFAFIAWNLLLFQGQRQATSLGTQLAILISAPIQTMISWFASLLVNVLLVLFSAWGVPLYEISRQVSAPVLLTGIGLGALTGGIYLLFAGHIAQNERNEKNQNWQREALWLGLAVVILGLLPIIIANRQVMFPGLSRYTLVSSVGVAILLVTFIYSTRASRVGQMFIALLIGLAILTHFSFGELRVQQTTSLRNFWWQVAWRVPQFEINSTLIVNYAQVPVEEEYFVWGPANLIYYPYKLYEHDYLQPGIYAAVPNDETVHSVLTMGRQDYVNRRTIRTYANYRNVILLSQPSKDSCVQVIDGRNLEFSPYEQAEFIAMAPHSEIEHIMVNEPMKKPPEIVFGQEPIHDWCYLYETASLARQRGNLQKVRELGDQAFAEQLFPMDPIEWMPFLEAYAKIGQVQKLEEISARIGEEPSVLFQACALLSGITSLEPIFQEQMQDLFCRDE